MSAPPPTRRPRVPPQSATQRPTEVAGTRRKRVRAQPQAQRDYAITQVQQRPDVLTSPCKRRALAFDLREQHFAARLQAIDLGC